MLPRHGAVATSVFAALHIISSVQGQNFGQTYTSVGCFSSNVGDIVYHNLSVTYNSYWQCSEYCIADNAPYMALNYLSCYCGNEKPTSTSEVAASQCEQTCPGYTPNICGSTGSPTLWSVLLTGAKGSGSHDSSSSASSASSPASSSSSSSAASSHSSVDPTIIQHTTYVTSNVIQTVIGSAATTSQAPSSGGGPSKVGIAVGVVIGVLVLCAIVGAVYFVLRHRRQKDIEKEHRRQSSMQAFTNAQRPPHMSRLPSNDSRLDPIIAARRQSDGSIADNVDFSRRVLKVTNPDDRW